MERWIPLSALRAPSCFWASVGKEALRSWAWAPACVRECVNVMILIAQQSVTSHLQHTHPCTHTLECPPLTPSYTLPTVPYIPRELHTHSFRHANPQSPLVTFCFYFSPVFSPQPSQLSKLILLLLQSDLSQFVWTQEFFFLCGCAV